MDPKPKSESDAAESSPGPIVETGEPGDPQPTPEPEAPAAAATVVNGDKNERVTQLAKELEDERAARKRVELDNAQLQDEVHRLTAPAPAPVTPQPPRPRPRKRGPLGVRIK
jgi:hypothetical protein